MITLMFHKHIVYTHTHTRSNKRSLSHGSDGWSHSQHLMKCLFRSKNFMFEKARKKSAWMVNWKVNERANRLEMRAKALKLVSSSIFLFDNVKIKYFVLTDEYRSFWSRKFVYNERGWMEVCVHNVCAIVSKLNTIMSSKMSVNVIHSSAHRWIWKSSKWWS